MVNLISSSSKLGSVETCASSSEAYIPKPSKKYKTVGNFFSKVMKFTSENAPKSHDAKDTGTKLDVVKCIPSPFKSSSPTSASRPGSPISASRPGSSTNVYQDKQEEKRKYLAGQLSSLIDRVRYDASFAIEEAVGLLNNIPILNYYEQLCKSEKSETFQWFQEAIRKERFSSKGLPSSETLWIMHQRLSVRNGAAIRELKAYKRGLDLNLPQKPDPDFFKRMYAIRPTQVNQTQIQKTKSKSVQALELLMDPNIKRKSELDRALRDLKLSQKEIESTIHRAKDSLLKYDESFTRLCVKYTRYSSLLEFLQRKLSKEEVINQLEELRPIIRYKNPSMLIHIQPNGPVFQVRRHAAVANPVHDFLKEISNSELETHTHHMIWRRNNAEKKMSIDERCANTFKSLFFSPKNVSELLLLIEDETQKTTHPLTHPLKTALDDLLSEKSPKFLKSFCIEVTQYNHTFFAEAFQNPNMLKQWLKFLKNNPEAVNQLKKQLADYEEFSYARNNVTRFIDEVVNRKDDFFLQAAGINALSNFLRTLPPQDWKHLANVFPVDENLLKQLYTSPGSHTGGINKLALRLMNFTYESDGEPVLHRAIKNAPKFEATSKSLLNDYYQLVKHKIL